MPTWINVGECWHCGSVNVLLAACSSCMHVYCPACAQRHAAASRCWQTVMDREVLTEEELERIR